MAVLSITGLPDYPFALAVKDDQLYVGTSCDNESILTVHQLDPATDTWTTLFSYNPESSPTTGQAVCPLCYDPWITDITQAPISNGYRGRAQTWLVDLEFFGSDLTLGVRDRMGDVWGHQVPDPAGGLTNAITAGELSCAYY